MVGHREVIEKDGGGGTGGVNGLHTPRAGAKPARADPPLETLCRRPAVVPRDSRPAASFSACGVTDRDYFSAIMVMIPIVVLSLGWLFGWLLGWRLD